MPGWISTPASAGCDADWAANLSRMVAAKQWSSGLSDIVNKLQSGQRLTVEDGIKLYEHPNLHEVGQLANMAKMARYREYVFFNSNVHINQTNICVLACKFCAFRRSKRQSDAYDLSIDAYLEEMAKYANLVDEVHSVGGLHPDWDVEHYENLINAAKQHYPDIAIKALTAVEIKHLSQQSDITYQETLERLKAAGLDSLPGGGAEILNDDVRKIICNGKESSSEYLEIHRRAHALGIPSNCTMLFGTIESIRDRVLHMDQLRKLADEYNLFQCFVPYPFLPDSTRLPEAQLATSNEVLRTIAVSRLMLDSIPHIKAYRMNIGDEVAELALNYGADDIDGTVRQESIMHLAGANSSLNYDIYQMAKLVKDAGFVPIKRNTTYTYFTTINIEPPKRPRRLNVIA
ncbi:MAG TPA: CofH family radical SAM protein [Candidatus Poseidoniaceae archaeon]|nr:aminofutalosine synthase MqnE [Euryarchaeota archaeon]DAC58747.1 MAG TPA: CofH family radical SAM protein [Candidatus Poseidoniales archaeon]HII37490.1 CofH family radical SAM protein [Candidatus Poseidoniaceae archaeon]|tara:strand:+ start:1874 stop:3082 length:1209 start_codon:yes stop_codon:yes gene_type:complete